jgi:hypothetical protein
MKIMPLAGTWLRSRTGRDNGDPINLHHLMSSSARSVCWAGMVAYHAGGYSSVSKLTKRTIARRAGGVAFVGGSRDCMRHQFSAEAPSNLKLPRSCKASKYTL